MKNETVIPETETFMNSDTRRKILENLHIPRWHELPAFDLYMDQVLSYLNQHLVALYEPRDKNVLTASMINNYVKNSIVKPPVRKHYRTYHLAYLFVVVLMKRCYSLQEISRLIQIYSNIEDSDRIAQDYDKFVTVFESSLLELLNEGSCSTIYFENPSAEQQLMVNVIRTLAYKIASEIEMAELMQPVLETKSES